MKIKKLAFTCLRKVGISLDANGSKLLSIRKHRTRDRCFIVGNGPSLSGVDLDLIANEDSMACNKIYLIYSETKWRPKYYLAVDQKVMAKIADDIPICDNTTILSTEQCVEYIKRHDHAVFRENYINSRITKYTDHLALVKKFHFSKNSLDSVSAGWTTLYSALQLAYWIGYKEVILIGVDHSYPKNINQYKSLYVPDKKLKSHFSDDYLNSKHIFDEPNLLYTTAAFHKAKLAFEANGRTLLNATRSSALDCIPKVNLESILK